MTIPKYLAVITLLMFGLMLSANALTVNTIGSADAVAPGTDTPESAFAHTKAFKEGFTPDDLRTLTFIGTERITGAALSGPIDLTGFCFALAFYAGTAESDGNLGFEVFSIIDGPGPSTFTFPQTGFDTGGPITSVDLFKCPDAGTTAMLLGSALAGLALVRRLCSPTVHHNIAK